MECKHSHFMIVEGKLRCRQCNKTPAEIKNKPIEDKVGERTEVKRIVPRGIDKIGRIKGR